MTSPTTDSSTSTSPSKPRLRLLLLLTVAGAFAAAGVASYYHWLPRTYRITGTITRGGQALEWQGENIMLQIIYVPLDRKRDPNLYRCEGDPKTGAYVLEGIPAGSYRVSIQQMDPYPTHDLLNFAYSLKYSDIERAVKGNDKIDIDLPEKRPRGKKK